MSEEYWHMKSSIKLQLSIWLLCLFAASCGGGGGGNAFFPDPGSGGSNVPAVTVPPVEQFVDNSPAGEDPATSWLKDVYQTLPAVDDADGVYQNASLQNWADEILRLTNIERANAGLTPLKRSRNLNYIAQAHARDMGLRDYFNHTAEGYGLSPFQRMDAVRSAKYRSAGENIAAGQHSPSQVVSAWMNSPGHRSNILNSSFEYLGVGVYYDAGLGSYKEQWVQMFASFVGNPDEAGWLLP
jgi:uncharacterized protein YkwD